MLDVEGVALLRVIKPLGPVERMASMGHGALHGYVLR